MTLTLYRLMDKIEKERGSERLGKWLIESVDEFRPKPNLTMTEFLLDSLGRKYADSMPELIYHPLFNVYERRVTTKKLS